VRGILVRFPATSHKEDEANLGTWAMSQHELNKKGTLDLDRQQRLEEIDIEWVLHEKVPWGDMLVLLKQFKEREGQLPQPAS
jgi:hypothetical protein